MYYIISRLPEYKEGSKMQYDVLLVVLFYPAQVWTGKEVSRRCSPGALVPDDR